MERRIDKRKKWLIVDNVLKNNIILYYITILLEIICIDINILMLIKILIKNMNKYNNSKKYLWLKNFFYRNVFYIEILYMYNYLYYYYYLLFYIIIINIIIKLY